jgi:hypothetical protein
MQDGWLLVPLSPENITLLQKRRQHTGETLNDIVARLARAAAKVAAPAPQAAEASSRRVTVELFGSRHALSDRSGDGVLQYARHIRSSGPGRLDGLVVNDLVPGPLMDPLTRALAKAEGEPYDPQLSPPAGYGYKILNGQGPYAEGGARSYLGGGRLTEGFAAVARPVRPAETGLPTFIMDNRDAIFEREFGSDTTDEVRAITVFDSGPGRTRTGDAD